MARLENSRAVQKTPEVTFSIELRPATCEQLDAGKRLFSRLIARAQASKNERAESARADRRKPPPVQSPSLTNRGTLSSKEGCG
jgi:hypothetical protein